MDPATLAVTATFTADLLREPLAFWLKELGLPLEVAFAPYNQVFQQLLDPSSLLSRNRAGIGVVLVRAEDWQRFEGGIAGWGAAAEERIERSLEELIAALEAAADRSPAPCFAALCPPSAAMMADPARAAFSARIEARFTEALGSRGGVLLIARQQLDTLYPVEVPLDPHGDELGHIPYTPAFFAALGTLIARKAYAWCRPPRKVIAVDCDETLWKGVCGEVGPMGVVIDAPHRKLQVFLAAQKEAGMLLCLASKNDEQDALDVFARRPEMPLSRADFVAARIDWRPKSANLRALAAELDLGLDSFIFVDDSPVEHAEVAAACPEVLAVELPADTTMIPAFLPHVWAFDHLRVTAEDRKRTALYQQNAQRERVRRDAPTLDDFLASLALSVTIARPGPAEITRTAQLTQRTNQFNCTARRRTEGEVTEICRSNDTVCLLVSVTDRFGDYGAVGVSIARPQGEALVVDTFLLSCRVLGRGVENRMLRALGEIASERGLARVDVPFIPTRKNRPARDFLDASGANVRNADGDGFVYRFPSAAAATLPLTPMSVAVAAAESDAHGALRVSTAEPAPSVLINRIARELRDVPSILAAIAASRRHGAAPTVGPHARTPVEASITEIWSEVLAIDPIALDQDFFEIGGDSLTAAQVVSRLRQSFQVHLPLDVLFDARTIAALAVTILQSLAAEQGMLDEIDTL